MSTQATITRAESIAGIGVHTGQEVRVEVLPAPPDHGIQFERVDLDVPLRLLASHAAVVDTQRATTLGDSTGQYLATVEHLVASLRGLLIDNVLVRVDGPELPIFDGSALPWVRLLQRAGRAEQAPKAHYLEVLQPVTVEEGPCWARLSPSPQLELEVHIDFPHPMIGRQSCALTLSPQRFVSELSPARTFGFYRELEPLLASGRAKGGSLDSVVVFDDQGLMNEDGLLWEDEPVRHKALDLVGDLGLLPGRLLARVECSRPGHRLSHALFTRLLSSPESYRMTTKSA